ncbi:HEAT repeat domain-containing protein [Paludisphaera rhizosphaerae]|uniref:HEAT repeat domain-containing protein n=1 Tax=Paludisphaera rhizosphaerae TaxID=2711216 RepID=UPI0013EA0681|nr:HEAT repeat domain-containing protein [Paludisphaera rhizosphaerae]
MRSPISLLVLFLLSTSEAASIGAELQPPAVAEGWSVQLAGALPKGFFPTAMTLGRKGELLVGGRSGEVLRVVDGRATTFADGLGPVDGLERVGDALLVLHPPFLAAIRDDDGDGRSESRENLVTGLGEPAAPQSPKNRGSGTIRLGMDGFLYFAIGDPGLAEARGRGGRVLRMRGGGVIRVRPNGSDLEVVSQDAAVPTGLVVSSLNDLFSFSSATDPRWGLRLIHHIPDGRYGYPLNYVSAEFRSLPATARLGQGSASDAVFLDESTGALELLLQCDPEGGAVYGQQVRKSGGTFVIENRIPVVQRGTLVDFRPSAVATSGGTLWLIDSGPAAQAGARLFRVSRGSTTTPAARPTPTTMQERIARLDDPSRLIRCEAQDQLTAMGSAAVEPLVDRLSRSEPLCGRVHALWALDAIGTPPARAAIRARLGDDVAAVRIQSVRSVGIRRESLASKDVQRLLTDRDAAVRREAAIALGRLGDRTSLPTLLSTLDDSDRFAAWSIRRAILSLGCDDREALVQALLDPRRREAALLMADESWQVPMVEALVAALGKTPDPLVRGRILSCLATQYRRYPDGSAKEQGGTPKKTEAWDPQGMAAVLQGLEAGLKDADASVRRQAVFGLEGVGQAAGPMLRDALGREEDVDDQAALVEALGALNDATSTRLLLPIVVDPKRAESVRSAALDSLNRLRGRDVIRARLTLLYEEGAPETLVAKALPALARDGFLPPNDLAGFLRHASPLVRAAAVVSLNPSRPLPPDVKDVVLARLDDQDPDVRRAAFLAAGPLKLNEAVPRLVEKARTAQDGDHTAVLAALCSLPDPRALPLYLTGLDDPDPSLRRGSLGALLAIRDRVEPELRRIIAEEGRSPSVILALRRVINRFETVKGWKVLGPFAGLPNNWSARDGSIDPAATFTNLQAQPTQWKPAVESGDGIVDLSPLRSTDSPVVATAHAAITTTSASQAVIVIEADGPMEVSLNGRRINPPTDEAQAPNYFAVNLLEGVNHLTAVSRPGPSSWRFAVSISQTEPAANR